MSTEWVDPEELARRRAGRQCGDCSLCCKLLSVAEIRKPTNRWCRHCRPGRGCGIYGERPDQCRTYECYWLKGMLPPEMKPNKIHAVAGPSENGTGWFIHLDPDYPGIEDKEPLKSSIAELAREAPVVLVRRGRYRLVSEKRVKLQAPDGSIWLSSDQPEAYYEDPVREEA